MRFLGLFEFEVRLSGQVCDAIFFVTLLWVRLGHSSVRGQIEVI